MDAFSYLSVLFSIIIGLAITQVLQGYRGLLLARGRVKLYAPTLIWSAMLLVFAAQLWWASFGLADHQGWTFAKFGMVLLQTVLLYMMTALVIPDMPADASIDLEAHYYREAGAFFGIAIAMLAVSILKDLVLDGELPDRTNLAFHAVFAVMAATAIVVRRPRYHLLQALAMTVFIIVYIALLFARLGEG